MIELTHDLNRVPNSDINSPVFVAPGLKLTSTNGVYRNLPPTAVIEARVLVHRVLLLEGCGQGED